LHKNLETEVRNLGGDPTDAVWRWFLLNGPHGDSFSWGQTKHNPPGYVGVDHLKRIVSERTELDPDFPAKALSVVVAALASTDPNILRRAIQVTAVVGTLDELDRIKRLSKHELESVAADARASVFHMRKRL
jgi:hypothetical protein